MDHTRGVRPPGGFSLVEVLVASLLLTIGALAAVTMQRTAVKGDQSAFSKELAVSLAGQLLEATKNLAYKDDRLDDTAGAWAAPDASLVATAPSHFTRDWMISDEAPFLVSNDLRKTIRARVRWNQAGGSQELILSTVKAW